MYRLDAKQAAQGPVRAGNDDAAPGPVLPEAAARVAARPAAPRLPAAVTVALIRLGEAALLAAFGLALYVLVAGRGPDLFELALILGTTAFAAVLAGAVGAHGFAAYRSLAGQILRAGFAWLIACAAAMLVALTLGAPAATLFVWLPLWFGAGLLGLFGFRVAILLLVRHWTRHGRLNRRTVIVGGGSNAEALVRAIEGGDGGDIELLGLFDDRDDTRSPERIGTCPKLGRVADLIAFARATRVDLVIVAMPPAAEARIAQLLKQLWVLPVDIHLTAHLSKLRFTTRAYSYIGDVPVFDMTDRPISEWDLAFKWVFDRAVAIALLVLLAPVMLAIALAIRLESRGPTLVRHARQGFGDAPMALFAFRTTRMAPDGMAGTEVTRIGRFLRKTSLDALPRLINVLRGDMSIVGPGPHAAGDAAGNRLYREAVDGYFTRHRIKPGMTGWAQIHGWHEQAGTADQIMQRVQHDLYYIEHWSPLLDVYIALMTPFALLRRPEGRS